MALLRYRRFRVSRYAKHLGTTAPPGQGVVPWSGGDATALFPSVSGVAAPAEAALVLERCPPWRPAVQGLAGRPKTRSTSSSRLQPGGSGGGQCAWPASTALPANEGSTPSRCFSSTGPSHLVHGGSLRRRPRGRRRRTVRRRQRRQRRRRCSPPRPSASRGPQPGHEVPPGSR